MRALLCVLLLAACSVPATMFAPGATTSDGSRPPDDASGDAGGDAATQASAMLSAAPSGAIALGTVVIGQTSAEETITISNDGDQASGMIHVSLDDTATGLAIADDGCSTTSLAGHATCTFGLTFTPTSSAAVQTTLHVTADPGGDVSKPVFGSGIVQGQIDITDTSYAFPDQDLGATEGTKVFTVRNTGQTQIGMPMPQISGDQSYEVLATKCNAPLDETDTCTITVQFAPTSVGQKAGSLVVSAMPGGSDTATLAGTARAHVAVTISGSGTVTSNPAGLACSGTCAADFTSSPVTLDASPGATAAFAGWGGDCSGTGSCVLTLDAAKNVTASFVAQAQIDITDASYTFPDQGLGAAMGTKVFTVGNTGQSPTGAPVVHTTGDYKVQSTTCTAPLGPTGKCTVTVQFAPTSAGAKTGVLSVSATPGGADSASLSGTAFAHVAVTISGSGTVKSTPAGITCPGTCAADFTSPSVTLADTPGAQQTFDGWSGGCSGTGGCSLTLDAAKSVTAAFSTTRYPVSVSFTSGNTTGTNTITSSPVGINCNGSTGCTGMFPYGSSVTLTANPDATWGRFVSWSSGPCAGSTSPVCTFTVPAATTTMAGSFTWFATMTILANAGLAGNSPVTTMVSSSDGTLSCSNTTTLSGTCVMHYGRNSSITFTYAGTPVGAGETTWTQCPVTTRYSVSTLHAAASGSCTPPDGTICTTGGCAASESCTMSFATAGDYTSLYDVACETTAVP